MTDSASHPAASPALLSELIGLIYEAASDLSLWPQLLESMAEYLTATGTHPSAELPDPTPLIAGWFQGNAVPSLAQVSEQEQFLLACLAPHFVRAHDIHQQLHEAHDERNLLEGVMNRLPLGMAIIDSQGSAISLNRALLPMLSNGKRLRLEAGRLVSHPRSILNDALARAREGGDRDTPLRLDDGQGEPMSLWLSRLAVPTSDGRKAERFVLLAASQTSRALSAEGLQALFDLTPAEARLTQQLVLGLTPGEAAATLGVSANTVKTHLKRIFAKVGVRRQAELLQAVYASPLWLHEEPPSGSTAIRSEAITADEHVRGVGIRLGDGRWLAYSDSGDPQGHPLLMMHALAGSRHLHPPDESVLLENGIRLIIPERPGSGDSDPQPGRRIHDWPCDVAALADHLGLGKFAVLGYSLGAPYALAVAAAMPERLSTVALVSAFGPTGAMEDLSHYLPTYRMGLMVARYAPTLLPPLMRVVVKGIRKNVYRYIEQSLAVATESDREVLENPRLRAGYAQGLLAGVKRGEQDISLEIMLAAQDWGIDLDAIDHTVRLWHGAADQVVALSGAEALAERLPKAEMTKLHGGGHYIIYSHWGTIIKEIHAAAACER